MVKDFWKNPAVANYLVQDIFDIDEIVIRFGGCPNDEDYKIIRTYYRDEFVGGEDGYETSVATKEDYVPAHTVSLEKTEVYVPALPVYQAW